MERRVEELEAQTNAGGGEEEPTEKEATCEEALVESLKYEQMKL